jgi:hypothetical protein
MASAKVLRRQASRCAILAKQTQDDEGRQRYLRLEQMYIQLADAEERSAAPVSACSGDSVKPAA